MFGFLGVDPGLAVPDVDREHNRGTDRRVHHPVVDRVARGFRRAGITQLVPSGVRHRIRHGVAKTITPPEVSDESAAWIRAQLAADTERLRELLGDDAPAWTRP